MRKTRVNWTIGSVAFNHLKKVSKEKGKSCSEIVENLIIQKLADPIERYTAEKRDLAKKMNLLDDKIKMLEQEKEEKEE